MDTDKIVWYFLPPQLKNKLHPNYDQVGTLISGFLIAGVLLFILPFPILFLSPVVAVFFIMSFLSIAACFAIKMGINYHYPTNILFIISFSLICYIVAQTDGILSFYVSAFYGVVLTGSWADKPFSTLTFTGLIFCLLAVSTPFLFEIWEQKSISDLNAKMLSALFFHLALSVFFLIFFWKLKNQNDKIRLQIRKQQINRISELDTAVKERNLQLSTIRQNLATDFHDETGNILAAITRQAGQLKLKLKEDHPVTEIVDNIIQNSEHLYSSSRDFLWSVNHESDDPDALFTYLTSFGQLYYNQFDIAFSVQKNRKLKGYEKGGQMPAFASRQLIFIFKEAMTNVIKHSGATEVVLEMNLQSNRVLFSLHDDGKWKPIDKTIEHNGLANMQKRVKENGLELKFNKKEKGTSLTVSCPLVNPYV